VIARLTAYRTPVDDQLLDEIADLARASWPVRRTNRRVEVDALFGRVVHCPAGDDDDVSFNGDAVPASRPVWTRGLLIAPERGELAAFAIATDRAALEQALEKFTGRATRVDDYDDVAYHFFEHRD
jgi:hypothetical protein